MMIKMLQHTWKYGDKQKRNRKKLNNVSNTDIENMLWYIKIFWSVNFVKMD